MANPSRKIIEAVQKSPLIRIPLKPTFPNGYVPADHTFCTPSFRNPLIRTYSSSPSPSPVDFSNSRSLTWLRFFETISKQKSPSGGFSQSLSQKHHFHTSFGNSHSNGFFPSVFSNSGHLISSASKIPTVFSQRLAFHKLGGFPLGCRYFSSKRPNFSQFNGSFMKSVAGKPLSSIRSAFLRYREAVGLQIEAFWRRNYMVLLGIGGFALCIGLWRFMFGIANTFVGFSEGMAKYGFLALSASIVAFAGLYVRSRFTINPDKVYRIAMRKLNTSAGILEVMGAPLSGTDLRAYVMSAGGLKLKNFKPTIGSKRCFLIFPIHGSERKGLVSVEVKKKKGQYDMKLLAVDIPMASGPDQRFFLIGDENEYQVGGGLIFELRDPIIKAMAAVKEFEALDEKEEEEDANRELEEAERKNREEIAKLEKDREEIVKLEKDNMQ